MDINQVYKKLNRNIKDYGLVASIKKSCPYIFRTIYDNRSWFVTKVDFAIGNTLRNPLNSFDFRLIQENDSEIIGEIENLEEWLKGKVGEMLSDNHMCVVAFDRDRLIGFYLGGFKEHLIPNTKVKLLLNKNEALGVQITVKKDYRGAGLATDLRRTFYKEVQAIGIKKVFGYVATHNKSSLNSAKKVQATVLGILSYSRVLNHNRLVYQKFAQADFKEDANSGQTISLSSKGGDYIVVESSRFL
jgi:GNAT superfamily N-acetyltransferase